MSASHPLLSLVCSQGTTRKAVYTIRVHTCMHQRSQERSRFHDPRHQKKNLPSVRLSMYGTGIEPNEQKSSAEPPYLKNFPNLRVCAYLVSKTGLSIGRAARTFFPKGLCRQIEKADKGC